MPEMVGNTQPFAEPSPQPVPLTHSDPGLPPAGHLRDEELRRRADGLAQAAEEQSGDRFAIDPHAFDIERELASQFSGLEVSHQVPGYTYCWVYTGAKGYFIAEKKSRRVLWNGAPTPCWEIVQGDMPEAIEFKGKAGDTTRQLGDVILMRCPDHLKDRLDAVQAEITRRRAGSGESDLRDLAAKYGVNVKSSADLSDPTVQRSMTRMANQAAASKLAFRQLGRQIREGSVPGRPAPR